MAKNGEINTRFGVYKNLCCGSEIVIAEGVAFPDCPRHLRLTTEWKRIEDDKIRHVSELFAPMKTKDPAA